MIILRHADMLVLLICSVIDNVEVPTKLASEKEKDIAQARIEVTSDTVCAAEAASVSFSSSLNCCSEITAQGTNYSAWPHLQFLPKISL